MTVVCIICFVFVSVFANTKNEINYDDILYVNVVSHNKSLYYFRNEWESGPFMELKNIL